MPAYAIAHLRDLRFGPDIAAYLQAIDATLAPYGGRFLVHGSPAEALEGPFSGDVVFIAFPDRTQAGAWYASPAYQAILPLRTRNAHGWVVLLDGAGEEHRATDLLRRPAPGAAPGEGRYSKEALAHSVICKRGVRRISGVLRPDGSQAGSHGIARHGRRASV